MLRVRTVSFGNKTFTKYVHQDKTGENLSRAESLERYTGTNKKLHEMERGKSEIL